MVKNVSQITIDGYGANETDFPSRLNQSSAQVQNDFNLAIVNPILAVLASPDQTAVLSIKGHSDRVDTPGLTREERRIQELDAASARANSATDGVFQMLSARSSGSFPADWADLKQAGVGPVALGGAVLINSDDVLSEPQRRQNRRVEFILFCFVP